MYFFFGTRWTAPMVLIVLSAFAAGLVIGVLGMVPRWWRQRRLAKQAVVPPSPVSSAPPVAPDLPYTP